MDELDESILRERKTNVAEVKPLNFTSKLPTPASRSRIQPPGSISKMPVPKRKASPDGMPPSSKRARVQSNTSFDESRSSSVEGRSLANRRPGLRRSVSTSSLNSLASSGRKTSSSINSMGKRVTVNKAVTRANNTSVAGTRPTSTRLNSTLNASKRTTVTNNAAKKVAGSKTTDSKPPSGKPTTGGGSKKRAPWDLKGRLQDMEQLMSSHLSANTQLQDQISVTNERIEMLENINQKLKGTVQQKEVETTEASQSINDLRNKLSEKELELSTQKRRWEEEMDDLRRKTQTQISDLEFSKSSLERQKSSLEDELTSKQQEIAGLKIAVSQLTSAQEGIKAQLEAVKASLEASQTEASEKQKTIDRLNQIIADQKLCIESMEERLREHELTRRKLHNTIQELKGNIRVFCRVRPLLGDETLGIDEIQHISFNPEDPRKMELEKLADIDPNQSVAASLKHGANGRYEFQFDRVFPPTCSQSDVFEEISQLVQSALDGYNVCIFAYGQTGSGKTYTMQGPDNPDDDTIGMIPRAVSQVFKSVELLNDKGWKYQFTANFVEIYNETIRDLLGDGKDDLKHDIKMVSSKSTDVFVTNLTEIPVPDEGKVHELLAKATDNRAVAATKCNERSSRSHSVFQLKIKGNNTVTSDTCSGTLNLVDLAGSERLKDSKSEGARLKEAQSINKSLSNLGNVIMALGNKDSHIPYRNSKLTHLLMNSLGGNSKTLMFVNVSPREDCFNETLNSLRFATKVNNCNIGTAVQKKK